MGVRVSSSSLVMFKNTQCGNSSVGRAQPCQGWGREFESRFPLLIEGSLAICSLGLPFYF